jgi:asparagine synthase (glutamine-hydrolysing)
MCGICGTVRLDGAPDTGPGVDRMLRALAHRGPDADGQWSDGTCTLGHRRLSIIDLSDAGRQPLANEDGTLWLTFNGEIYNFQALRRELEAAGHAFRSQTDSEVVVHAYEEWGTGAVTRFRGMFALALWDTRRRRLWLARDRVGKKPLVFAQVRDRFVFASEIQALLAHPGVPRDVDPRAIHQYFSLGYVPAPGSAFAHIRKLQPGHSMTLDLGAADGRPRTETVRYWALSYEPKRTWSFDQAQAALRETLTEAVRIRMISDVPLGAFLSGGIDSSIVVGLMAGISTRPVKTFSIGFADDRFDEREAARRVAQRWATDHQELVVEPDAAAVVPTLVRHFGEPFADSSALPTYYVAQLTRAAVTVALTGDGGDESFAGYRRYRAHRLAGRVAKIPGAMPTAAAAGRLLPVPADSRGRTAGLRRFLVGIGDDPATRYARWIGASNGHLDTGARAEFYRDDFLRELHGSEPENPLAGLFTEASGLDPVDAAMQVDVRSYLPDDLLVKVDIASMANSLEARAPLLDQEVMELAAGLPSVFKLDGRLSKRVLKAAFSDVLPPENVTRPKQGFGVPVGPWFRGPLAELAHDTFLATDAAIARYLDPRAVRRAMDAHVSGAADHGYQLWNFLMLELWHRLVVMNAE